MCGTSNPNPNSEQQKWNCLACTFSNDPKSTRCAMCGTSNPNPKPRIYNDPNRKNSTTREEQYYVHWPSDHRAVFSRFSITPFPTTSAIATTTTATPTSSFATTTATTTTTKQ